MGTPLRALIIEDSDDDRILLLRTLRQSGYDPEPRCLETASALSAALAEATWDIVLSDHRLPQFNGIEALALVRSFSLDLPFILISGVIGEEQAVAIMRAGANDYVLKDNLARLGPAIARELRDAEVRRQHRLAEANLRASEAQFRLLFESNPNPMWVYDEETLQFLAVNDSAVRLYGYTRDEFLALALPSLYPPEARGSVRDVAGPRLDLREPPGRAWRHQRKDGTALDVEITASAIPFNGRPGQLVLATDVTARLKAEQAVELNRRREAILAKTAHRLLAVAEPQLVVKELCEEVMQFLDCDVFFNYLLDATKDCLRLNACGGISKEEAARIEWLGKGIAVCGCVARDGRRIVVEDIPHANDPRTALVASYGVQAYCCHPLLSQGRTLGTLSFGACRRTAFTAEDLSMMAAVTEQVALAMQRLLDREALRESREDLNRAQAVAHVGNWRLRLPSNELLWSDENWQIFGLPRDTPLTYETFLNTVHPLDRATVHTCWSAALKGEPYDIEHRIVVGEAVKWVRERAELEFDEHGALVGAFGTTQDVTDHKHAEEVKARYELIAEYARDPLLLIAPDGRIVECNRAAGMLYGYTRQEMLSLTFSALCLEAQDTVSLQTQQALDGGLLFESQHVSRDGTAIPVEVSARGVSVSGERMLLSVIRDIRQRRETEHTLRLAKEEAEKANRAKSEFLAGMSHELRTPLNAVMGFSQVLENEYFGPLNAKQKEYVHDIYESGRHLLSLLTDILDLSKIEAGRFVPDWSRFNAGDFLQHALVLIRETCCAHRVRLGAEIAAPVSELTLTADQRRLKQVLYNILSNAAKFTPDGGAITLHAALVEKEEPWLRVAVADTGIGIASEHQARVFDSFYQVRQGTSDKTPGTGLGLSLTRQLLAMHGGRIWVESDGEGHGSQFIFELPADARSAGSHSPAAAAEACHVS